MILVRVLTRTHRCVFFLLELLLAQVENEVRQLHRNA
jgi:hypothetical protein